MIDKRSPRPLKSPLGNRKAVVKVLLIEDEESYAGLVTLLLSANPEQDCETTVASTLAAGMEQLSSDRDFDAVLLDLTLPDSEGLATLLRLTSAFPNISIIVLTGSNDAEQGVRAVGAGAQDYLVKGDFEPNQLYRVLRFSMERKHILMRLEEAQRIARIGNWEFRPAEDFFFASKEVYLMLGIDPAERLYAYTDILQAECPFHLLRSHEDALESQVFQQRIECLHPDGQQMYLLLNSRREERENGSVYYVGTLQDITLQKKTEELERAQQLSKEAARVREQLIATVSHELRTPMNAIVGMSNLLVKTPLNGEQQEYMFAVQEASHLLLGIINDILLTSSLQNGALELENQPFDLTLTVRRITEVLQPKARAKGLKLTYTVEPVLSRRIAGDKQRISQILYNILGNAVKFTERGSVDLKVSWFETPTGSLRLSFAVKDTGPGIPEDNQDKIFQAFNRIKQSGQRQEGTGLGLTIAKQLTERMGGSIHLYSTLGKGSVFTIEIPVKTAVSLAVTARKEEPQPALLFEKKRIPEHILIVEDHPMNQIVLHKTLEQRWPEISIILAKNGAEARGHLAANDFDLIFMDLQLPDEDGFTLTRFLRTDLKDKHGNTPVLAMTAQSQIAEDERYLEAGMNDYLLKPFNPDELFEKITQQIK